VRLVGVYQLTARDGDEAFYVEQLHDRQLPEMAEKLAVWRAGAEVEGAEGAETATTAATAAGVVTGGHGIVPRPVTEDEVVTALQARGFKILYAGDLEVEWLEP
jgi:hypothetical protein